MMNRPDAMSIDRMLPGTLIEPTAVQSGTEYRSAADGDRPAMVAQPLSINRSANVPGFCVVSCVAAGVSAVSEYA